MGMTEEKLIKGSDAKRVPFRFPWYMPSQRDRCPLQRRLLTGEKSNSGHETSRESEMRIDHFKTDNKMCHLNKALQHITACLNQI